MIGIAFESTHAIQVQWRKGPNGFVVLGQTPEMVSLEGTELRDVLVAADTAFTQPMVTDLVRQRITGVRLASQELHWLQQFPDLSLLRVVGRSERPITDADFGMESNMMSHLADRFQAMGYRESDP